MSTEDELKSHGKFFKRLTGSFNFKEIRKCDRFLFFLFRHMVVTVTLFLTLLIIDLKPFFSYLFYKKPFALCFGNVQLTSSAWYLTSKVSRDARLLKHPAAKYFLGWTFIVLVNCLSWSTIFITNQIVWCRQRRQMHIFKSHTATIHVDVICYLRRKCPL